MSEGVDSTTPSQCTCSSPEQHWAPASSLHPGRAAVLEQPEALGSALRGGTHNPGTLQGPCFRDRTRKPRRKKRPKSRNGEIEPSHLTVITSIRQIGSGRRTVCRHPPRRWESGVRGPPHLPSLEAGDGRRHHHVHRSKFTCGYSSFPGCLLAYEG